jgi:hypothetical protein
MPCEKKRSQAVLRQHLKETPFESTIDCKDSNVDLGAGREETIIKESKG